MSSTIVYQELQSSSCYEFLESRQLSLKLTSPKCSNNSNFFSWSNIEALANPDKTRLEKDEPVYIHPLVKHSSSKLSQKSLEMCTESLGCETGTCIMESSVFFQSTMSNQVRKPRSKPVSRKEITQVKQLPPPLTSITGPNPIQVKPVRENGRLIIQAISTPVKPSCFRAERSNGRLVLSLVQDHSSNVEYCETSDNIEQNYIHTEVISKDELEPESEPKPEPETETEAEPETEDVKIMVGVKMGRVKIQTPSRCKERGQVNKRFVNWERFWVAT